MQQAVGASEWQIIVPPLDYREDNNFGGLQLGSHTEREVVPLITIDSQQLKACHFLKLDIEGMEREAIIGARQTIRKYLHILYVENDCAERATELINTSMELGYELYWHCP